MPINVRDTIDSDTPGSMVLGHSLVQRKISSRLSATFLAVVSLVICLAVAVDEDSDEAPT
jgi:hypothetical protein